MTYTIFIAAIEQLNTEAGKIKKNRGNSLKWLYVHELPVPLSKKEEKKVTFIRDWKIFVLWDNCLLATLGKSYQHVSLQFLTALWLFLTCRGGSASGFVRHPPSVACVNERSGPCLAARTRRSADAAAHVQHLPCLETSVRSAD